MARCVKHHFDDAVGACRTCSNEFCSQCLVWPHGPQRPPLCVECALAKAGVRSHTMQKSVIAVRQREATVRAAAAEERKAEMAAMRSRVGRRGEAVADLSKAPAGPGRSAGEPVHHLAMAGRVRLLLLLIVAVLAGLGVLLQVTA